MKKAIKTLAVVTLAFMPLAASAQENISKAIDLFGADTGTYGIWNKTEDRDSKGIFSTIYKFKLPKSRRRNSTSFVKLSIRTYRKPMILL